MKTEELGPLPPGWDSKFDPRTGRYYFINHYTMSTSWEDPRVRYQQIGKPTSLASSSKEHKFPTHTLETSSLVSASSKMTSGGGGAGTIPSYNPHDIPIQLQGYPLGKIPVPVSSSAPSNSNTDFTSPHVIQTSSAIQPTMGVQSSSIGGFNHFSGSSNPYAASPHNILRLQVEDSINNAASPKSIRSITNNKETSQLADILEVESSFIDPDLPVKNIASMFPTVDENHIRTLLKKYHGSQAVVISALQVAKHPFITPGPSSGLYGTPPPNRHSTLPGVASGVLAGITMTGSLPHYYNNNSNTTPIMGIKDGCSVSSSGYPTPRPGSAASGFDNSILCIGSPQIGSGGGGTLFKSFPRPHSSPKMKLRNSYLEIPTINQLTADEKRISKLLECNSKNKIDIQYLKSVFPSVEEYVLLDVLSNSDNNVQKASDRLIKMGNVKRDTPSAPRLSARKKEEERLAEKRTPLPKPPPIKTDQEKVELRKKMIETYETRFDIPERILFMALESVLYDEEQANNLINSMIEDDLKRKKAKELEKAKEKQKKKSPKPNRKSLEITTPSSPKKDFKKGEKRSSRIESTENLVEDCSTVTRGTSTQEDGPGRAKGPNPALCKGPNDGLLLKDYVTWNGPDPSHAKGVNNSLASGPNSNHLSGCKNHLVKGHQESLAKGPKGLNKGSMYKNISKENETTRSS